MSWIILNQLLFLPSAYKGSLDDELRMMTTLRVTKIMED